MIAKITYMDKTVEEVEFENSRVYDGIIALTTEKLSTNIPLHNIFKVEVELDSE